MLHAFQPERRLVRRLFLRRRSRGRVARRNTHAERFPRHDGECAPQLPDSSTTGKFPPSYRQSSSQKRSLKYFAAESAKTVTITACSPAGIPPATERQPFNAAAALGLTSKPSSRAIRFTIS